MPIQDRPLVSLDEIRARTNKLGPVLTKAVADALPRHDANSFDGVDVVAAGMALIELGGAYLELGLHTSVAPRAAQAAIREITDATFVFAGRA